MKTKTGSCRKSNYGNVIKLLSFLFLIILATGCNSHATRNSADDQSDYFPEPDSAGGWRTLADAADIKEKTGMDPVKLDEAFEFIRGTTKNGGLLVLRHGYLIYEKYFGKGQRDATPNLGSCGKSFTSIAFGIMMHENPGKFPDGMDQEIFTPEYLPEKAVLVAVYADTLTRGSIMEAVRARHTYGVTADRIELDFRVNGRLMGESVAGKAHNSISVKVKGKDEVDRVEILKNNRVIYRDHPVDRVPAEDKWQYPVLCRIEFGWGPWKDLDMAKICDWDMEAAVSNGKILSVTPCFQSGPFDELRRNTVDWTESNCKVISYTSRNQAFAEKATNSIILEVRGSAETVLTLTLHQPSEKVIIKTFEELEKSNSILFTGPFTSESLAVQRLVFHDHYFTEFKYEDPSPANPGDYYYARVTQSNGSLAWSSPVWIRDSVSIETK